MLFNLAQTFYIDPDAVQGSSTVSLTDVSLFFNQKPLVAKSDLVGFGHIPAYTPSVIIFIATTDANNAPTSNLISGSFARVEYNFINVSMDSNTPTKFSFVNPIPVTTGSYYAIMIHFDSPEFSLWSSVAGDALIGTNNSSPGPSGKYCGAYYEMGTDGTNTDKSSTDLKFIVNIAQYTANNIGVTLKLPSYEFLNFDSPCSYFLGGEICYQDFGGTTSGNLSSNVTFYGIGQCSIVSNSYIVTGSGTHFTNNATGFIDGNYIVFTDGTYNNVSVCQIGHVTNDTHLTLSQFPSFNTAVSFFKKTVVGSFYNINYANNSMILQDSTANTTVQWTPTAIKTISINAGGVGYNNSDYIVVSNGTINAILNVFTNTSGGIIRLNFTNAGAGFIGPSSVNCVLTVKASNGAASNGSSCNLVPMIGSTLRGGVSGLFCNVNSIFDFRVDIFSPDILVKIPDVGVQNSYCNFSNAAHYVTSNNEFAVTLGQLTTTPFDCFILSRTTEVNTPNSQLYETSNGEYRSCYMDVQLSVNQPTGLFSSPYVYNEKLDLVTFTNDVNNDDFGEVTNNGNCRSKSVSISVTFANNNLANNCIVYLSAYTPLGTNIKCYAKLHNTNDPDLFEDKSWSPMKLANGGGGVSSLINNQDLIQYEYTLPLYPKSQYTLPGTSTLTSGNSVILTTVNCMANVVTGNLIKIYSPISSFANGNYMISLVSAVNSTAITIASSTSNVSMLTPGMLIDVLNDINTVYCDIQNGNTATYFNNETAQYTGFNTMAFKVLLMATNTYIVPVVTNFRAVGVA
jgi:hypothetical protein